MPYIGKQPEHGRFAKLDQINSGFDGSVVTFNLTVDSVAVYPTNPQNLLVSIGGVIQQPGTDYTVSAATLTLTSAPAASTDFFGVLLGDVLDIGTPSDGSVTVSKMAANSVDSDQYVDGSINLVHMSDNAIGTDEIVADAVTNAKLANMATRTVKGNATSGSANPTDVVMADGDFLIANASGLVTVPIAGDVAVSNTGAAVIQPGSVDIAMLSASQTASSSTFLRGDNQWQAAGGGAFTLLGTTVASNDGTVGVNWTTSTDYDSFLVTLSDMVPGNDGPYAYFRIGDSSGVDNGSGEYAWHLTEFRSTSTAQGPYYNNSDTQIKLMNRGVGSAAGEGFSATIWINSPTDGTIDANVTGTFTATSYLAEAVGGLVIGKRKAVIALDRVQFLFHDGNVESGRISVFGAKHV